MGRLSVLGTAYYGVGEGMGGPSNNVSRRHEHSLV